MAQWYEPNLWWLKPKPESDSGTRGFELGLNFRQQLIQNQQNERRLKLYEQTQNQTFALKMQQFALEESDRKLFTQASAELASLKGDDLLTFRVPSFHNSEYAKILFDNLKNRQDTDATIQWNQGMMNTLMKLPPRYAAKPWGIYSQNGLKITPEVTEAIQEGSALYEEEKNKTASIKNVDRITQLEKEATDIESTNPIMAAAKRKEAADLRAMTTSPYGEITAAVLAQSERGILTSKQAALDSQIRALGEAKAKASNDIFTANDPEKRKQIINDIQRQINDLEAQKRTNEEDFRERMKMLQGSQQPSSIVNPNDPDPWNLFK